LQRYAHMVSPDQFKVGDRVALRGEGGVPDAQTMGVIEKVEFQPPPGDGAHSCFYVVRRSNGGYFDAYFAAGAKELVRFE
jgi:hypothetical protein